MHFKFVYVSRSQTRKIFFFLLKKIKILFFVNKLNSLPVFSSVCKEGTGNNYKNVRERKIWIQYSYQLVFFTYKILFFFLFFFFCIKILDVKSFFDFFFFGYMQQILADIWKVLNRKVWTFGLRVFSTTDSFTDRIWGWGGWGRRRDGWLLGIKKKSCSFQSASFSFLKNFFKLNFWRISVDKITAEQFFCFTVFFPFFLLILFNKWSRKKKGKGWIFANRNRNISKNKEQSLNAFFFFVSKKDFLKNTETFLFSF